MNFSACWLFFENDTRYIFLTIALVILTDFFHMDAPFNLAIF